VPRPGNDCEGGYQRQRTPSASTLGDALGRVVLAARAPSVRWVLAMSCPASPQGRYPRTSPCPKRTARSCWPRSRHAPRTCSRVMRATSVRPTAVGAWACGCSRAPLAPHRYGPETWHILFRRAATGRPVGQCPTYSRPAATLREAVAPGRHPPNRLLREALHESPPSFRRKLESRGIGDLDPGFRRGDACWAMIDLDPGFRRGDDFCRASLVGAPPRLRRATTGGCVPRVRESAPGGRGNPS
jgi:hypothetical protein